MIVYNVSIKVRIEVAAQWQDWMTLHHLPAVMASGCFEDHRFYKLCEQDDPDALTFVVQYYCQNMENYSTYRTTFAPALQAQTNELFKDQFLAFRTLMEDVR